MIEGVGTWVLRIVDGTVEALLVRRSMGVYRGEWFTVDGTIEQGESPRQAALRELAEETSIVPRELFAGTDSPVFIETLRGRVRLHSFVTIVPAHQNIVLNEEHTAWRWAPIDDAMQAVPLASQRFALARAVRLANARQHATTGTTLPGVE